MITILFEAALRALCVAILVGAGLFALRVHNVVAQKIAWVLALGAALAMPLVMHWNFLPNLQLPVIRSAKPAPSSTALSGIKPEPADPVQTRQIVVLRHSDALVHETHQNTPPSTAASQLPIQKPARKLNWLVVIESVYLVVLAALLLRLAIGLLAAWRLWARAQRVSMEALPLLEEGCRVQSVRASERVKSPVTICSGILLPADFAAWPEEKLRVVLTHEQSHVQQRDFYLQLAAGAHAAVFWFSPLGWWLKRKLTELSETISDGAAVRAARDAESYAEMLLEFAAGPHPVLSGVAMARQSNLASRIERILNDGNFKTAFAGGRIRMVIAAVLVPMALLAATVHVQGASQEQGATVNHQQPNTVTVTAQAQPDGAASATRQMTVIAQAAPSADAEPVQKTVTVSVTQDGQKQGDKVLLDQNGDHKKSFFNYSFNDDGDSWGLVMNRDRSNLNFSSNSPELEEQFNKALKTAKGDFFWFTRDGKSYVIDDPQTVKQIGEAMSPLGKNFDIELPEFSKVEIPENIRINLKSLQPPSDAELKRNIKDLEETLKKLDAKIGNGDTQKDIEALEGKLGELQGKLGMVEVKLNGAMLAKIQSDANLQLTQAQKASAEAMKLQGQQLEETMKVEGQQLKIRTQIQMMDEDRVKQIIDECMKNAKAKPVQ